MGDVRVPALAALALVTLGRHLIRPLEQAEVRARPTGLQRVTKGSDRIGFGFGWMQRLLLALVPTAANQLDAAPGTRFGQGHRGGGQGGPRPPGPADTGRRGTPAALGQTVDEPLQHRDQPVPGRS